MADKTCSTVTRFKNRILENARFFEVRFLRVRCSYSLVDSSFKPVSRHHCDTEDEQYDNRQGVEFHVFHIKEASWAAGD